MSAEACPTCKRPYAASVEERAKKVATHFVLTPAQSNIVLQILVHQDRCGSSPTFRFMATVLGVSKTTIFEHVNECERKGAIKRTANRIRSLKVVENFEGN